MLSTDLGGPGEITQKEDPGRGARALLLGKLGCGAAGRAGPTMGGALPGAGSYVCLNTFFLSLVVLVEIFIWFHFPPFLI